MLSISALVYAGQENYMNKELIQRVAPKLNRYLAVRDRAENEVKIYMKQKQLCSDDEMDQILDYLREKGLVDEHRFAENRALYRQERGYGPLYIRNELKGFRISDQVLREIAELNDEIFLENALDILSNKLPSVIGEENCEVKLRNALMYKGYTGRHIEQALKLLKEKFPHWSRKPYE